MTVLHCKYKQSFNELQQQQLFNSTLSGTTRVSWHQNSQKH